MSDDEKSMLVAELHLRFEAGEVSRDFLAETDTLRHRKLVERIVEIAHRHAERRTRPMENGEP